MIATSLTANLVLLLPTPSDPFLSRFKDAFEIAMVVFDGHEYLTEEERRLKEDRDRVKYWKKWGPYVAERQWATGEFGDRSWLRSLFANSISVREDYSPDGDAWSRT